MPAPAAATIARHAARNGVDGRCRVVEANAGEDGTVRTCKVQIIWQGGASTRLQMPVPASGQHGHATSQDTLDLIRRPAAERLTEEFRRGSCHAGRYETSLVLADAPDQVDRRSMSELPSVPVDMPAEIAAGARDFPAMGMTSAYCGAPAEATPEEGEQTFQILSDMLVELVRQRA